MKYIDIHAHAYRFPLQFVTRFCSADELIARYDYYGIEAGMVLPVVNSEIYLPQSNEDILEMATNYPGRLLPFCNLDPRALINRADAPLDIVLQYYKEQGCLGIGEIMPNLPIEDELVQNLFACAEKVGLPVTTDGSDRVGGDFGLCDQPGMPGLEHTLCRFPDLRFIGHGPVFWSEYTVRKRPAQCKPVIGSDGVQRPSAPPDGPVETEGVLQDMLREFPNLYGELSDGYWQLRRDEDYAVRFLTEFQDKLFFGTDCCNALTEDNFQIKIFMDKLHESGKLPDQVWKKICRNNAIKFFNLELELG